MKKTLLAAVISSALISGCASIVSDSNYPVRIDSLPKGASFVVKNRSGIEVANGVTPEVVNLKAGAGFFKSEQYTVQYTSTSGEEKTVTIQSTLDGWYFGNLLIGGLLGMLIIDPATGAMWKLPEGQTVSLAGNPAPTATSMAGEEVLTIVSIDQIPVSDRIGLVRIN